MTEAEAFDIFASDTMREIERLQELNQLRAEVDCLRKAIDASDGSVASWQFAVNEMTAAQQESIERILRMASAFPAP